MKEKLSDLRVNYDKFELIEEFLPDSPFELFKLWFNDTKESSIMEPNAMTLGTTDEEGNPKLRIVLLKEFSNDGFVFFTNYISNKAIQLSQNKNAALLFFWNELHRQVRIEGKVEKLSREESVEYFSSRPYESRLGAIISKQSEILSGREELENKFNEMKEKYPDEPPCPDNWGGYILKPTYFEFWQGRESRLHDRIVYDKNINDWKIKRLYP